MYAHASTYIYNCHCLITQKSYKVLSLITQLLVFITVFKFNTHYQVAMTLSSLKALKLLSEQDQQKLREAICIFKFTYCKTTQITVIG